MSWLLYTVLWRTLRCTCLFQIWFPWCVCPAVEILVPYGVLNSWLRSDPFILLFPFSAQPPVSHSQASNGIACFLPWVSPWWSSWPSSRFFTGSDSGLPATFHHSWSLCQITWLCTISPDFTQSQIHSNSCCSVCEILVWFALVLNG